MVIKAKGGEKHLGLVASQQMIPDFYFHQSSVEQISSDTDVLLNCNFIVEQLVCEANTDSLDITNQQTDVENVHSFIADLVTELISSAIYSKKTCIGSVGDAFPSPASPASPDSSNLLHLVPVTYNPSYQMGQDFLSLNNNQLNTGTTPMDIPATLYPNPEYPPGPVRRHLDISHSSVTDMPLSVAAINHHQSSTSTASVHTAHSESWVASDSIGSENSPAASGSVMAAASTSSAIDLVLSDRVVMAPASCGLVMAPATSYSAFGSSVSTESSGSVMVQGPSDAMVTPGLCVAGIASGEVLTSQPNQQAKSKGQGRSSSKGHTCPHCGIQGILGPSKLQIHIERMHSAPVFCKICSVSFVDKYCFVLHYPNCFYFCPRQNCNFHDKRKERFDGHMRTHYEWN